MIRQAHTYLVSAMSGAALIAVAIAVFVVLVSAQVFRDWPIADLGGDGDETAPVSRAEQVRPPVDVAGAAAGPSLVGADRKRADRASANSGSVATHVLGTTGDGGTDSGGSGGRDGGAGTPSSPAQVPTPSNPSGNGSAGAGSASGGANGGGANAGTGSGTAPSTAGTVTSTVNDTVTKVDEAALGGALHESGVTPVTEGVVEGVAGPESPLGKVVDETTGAVGNLLPGNR